MDQSQWVQLPAKPSSFPRPPLVVGDAAVREHMANVIGQVGARAGTATGKADAEAFRDWLIWCANWCNYIAGDAGGVSYSATL